MIPFDEKSGLPEALRRELRGMIGPARGMDAGRDAGILAAARAAGEAEVARRRRYWRMMGAVGMAAAVALAAGIMWRELETGRLAERGAPSVAGSGNALEMDPQAKLKAAPFARTGDIRDAFYLARQIKAAEYQKVELVGAWDVNGDGVVDGKDVNMLALAAVRVGGEKGVVP